MVEADKRVECGRAESNNGNDDGIWKQTKNCFLSVRLHVKSVKLEILLLLSRAC